MSALSDVLATAQQLRQELSKFEQGELSLVKDLAQNIEENIKLLVDKETSTATPPPASTEGVQTSGDLGANPPAQPA